MSGTSAHQVIARKFRPSQFDELMGQDHVSRTLQNAIRVGRIAHAYMFSGPRGVGKTTTARLLAKSLNCEKGPTPFPCGECVYCHEIKNGNCLLVMEIDGATHTGVDQVRSVTDLLQYNVPDQKYKVIIIDEVHMLSNSAFNALLKSLEEPPSRVVFIFATTELHKVPETIQSRCQVHVFQLIALPEISERLANLCQKENITTEPSVLPLVSKCSGGSMRDAETLLEKLISFCGNDLKEQDVSRCLGMAPKQLIRDLAHHIQHSDKKEAFTIVQTVFNQGLNINKWISQNIEWFRAMLFYIVSPDLMVDLDFAADDIEIIKSTGGHFNEHELVYILDQWIEIENQIKYTASQRVLIETGIIKLCNSKHIIPVDVVLKRLNDMESRVREKMNRNPKQPEPERDEEGKKKNLTLPSIEDKWPDFLKVLESHHKILFNHLQNSRLGLCGEKTIELRFDLDSVFDYKALNDSVAKKNLEQELHAFFKMNYQVIFKVDDRDIPEVPEDNFQEVEADMNLAEATLKVREIIQSNTLVSKAIETFEGKVIKYRQKQL